MHRPRPANLWPETSGFTGGFRASVLRVQGSGFRIRGLRVSSLGWIWLDTVPPVTLLYRILIKGINIHAVTIMATDLINPNVGSVSKVVSKI